MPNRGERIRHLLEQLARFGVDRGLLQQVATHLPAHTGDPAHWAELAAVLRRAQNYGAAQCVYESALALHPEHARLWNNYGILLRDWGQLKEARRAFERALALDPGYAKALANKGRMLEMTHRFAEARCWYEKALHADPSDAGVANNIGVCLLGEGQPDSAEEWFTKALELDPEWADALFNLAALSLDRKDFDSARPLVDRLSRLLPDDREVESLRARLKDRTGLPGISLPDARKLEGDLSPRMRKLCRELRGNPRSLFISYAWPDPTTGSFAARLAEDLASHSYQVILDQEQNLEVHEILCLLVHCQNVVVLNDQHYSESCLLGKVPTTALTSAYPSFAFPLAEAQSEDYLGLVFKISAVAWEVAKQLQAKGDAGLREMAFEIARPDAFGKAPGLRIFIEGWRVDEMQMVFANLERFRSLSVAYLGGDHCLAGYPLFDFSSEEFYAPSLSALLQVLELSKQLGVDDAPVGIGKPDFSDYRWPDSSIVSAKFWRIADDDVGLWRPSITPSGDHGAVVSRFKDWVPL